MKRSLDSSKIMPEIRIHNQKELLSSLSDAPFKAVVRQDKYQKVLKRIVSQAVEEHVYERYSPTQYERRYSKVIGGRGGLASEQSVKVIFDAQKQKVTVTNMAMGRDYDAIHDAYQNNNTYLTPIIETGQGYSWKKSWIYRHELPRPFMNEVLNEVSKYFPTLIEQRGFNNTDNKITKESPF